MSVAVKLDILSDNQIQVKGIEALREKLGVVGTLKFLEQFDNGGSGDYTKEKYLEEDKLLTKAEILNMFP